MITLLHGDNVAVSRNELNNLKSAAKNKEIRTLAGANLEEVVLAQALESGSLLGSERLIIIENLLSKIGKKIKILDQLLRRLEQSTSEVEIILWEDREIEPSTLKKLPGRINLRLFKLPTVIFQILDGLKPGCSKQLLPLLGTNLQTEPAEIIFTLMVRRIRQLIMLKDRVSPEGLQGWQASRLTNQTKSFTLEKLLELESGLLEIETNLKTGQSPFSLGQSLEQFIINL